MAGDQRQVSVLDLVCLYRSIGILRYLMQIQNDVKHLVNLIYERDDILDHPGMAKTSRPPKLLHHRRQIMSTGTQA